MANNIQNIDVGKIRRAYDAGQISLDEFNNLVRGNISMSEFSEQKRQHNAWVAEMNEQQEEPWAKVGKDITKAAIDKAGTAVGYLFGGPIGANIGQKIQESFKVDDPYRTIAEQNANNQVNGTPGQAGQPAPTGILGPVESKILSREEQASQALRDLQSIISPTFQKAGEDISSLLGEARAELGGFQGQGVQQQLYSDLLSGKQDITKLPQFQAQAQALQNVLGFTGQTQSPTGTAFAFQPLISDVFSQIEAGARAERAQDIGLAKNIADLFRTEGIATGALPIQELGTRSDIARLTGSQLSGFAQQLLNLGIQEESFKRTGQASERLIQQQEAAAEGKAIAESIKFAYENREELGDLFKDAFDFFTGGGSNIDAFEHY